MSGNVDFGKMIKRQKIMDSPKSNILQQIKLEI